MAERESSPPPGVPGWRRADCLGCGELVKAHRDHHLTFVGTIDGARLLVFPLGPEHGAQSSEFDDFSGLLVLGVSHRECLEQARKSIESGSLNSRPLSEFPIAIAEEVNEESVLWKPPDEDHCPFCDSADDLTDEDIWPVWFWQYLRDTGRKFQGHGLPSVTTPVCANCNNRWMSVLENDTAPLIKRMFTEAIDLSSDQRQVLATWATKIALLLARSLTPRGFHQDFAIRRVPPPSFAVWLGRYAGNKHAIWGRARGVQVFGTTVESPDAVVVTFTAHRLLFQVAAHFTTGGAKYVDGRTQYVNALIPLWPLTLAEGADWPPRNEAFAYPADLDALHESITPS